MLDDHHAHRRILPQDFAQPVGHFGRHLDPREAAADHHHSITRGRCWSIGECLQMFIECDRGRPIVHTMRSEEHTSELQSLMRISYAVFCLKKKNNTTTH